MSDDLVKRLRNPIDAFRPTLTDGKLAADRVEELEARNRELALQVIASEGQAQEAHEAQFELEAKLAKAVEFAKIVEEYACARRGNGSLWDFARTTLAELTGGKDE